MDTKFEDIVSEISQTVLQYPDNIAIVENGSPVMTYKQLWENALRMAGGLTGKDSAADYALVELPKSAGYIVSILGCWIAGKAFVPIGPDLPQARSAYIKSLVNTDLLINESSYAALLDSAPAEHMANITADTPAYIIFSSGTTGLPKGIVVGHAGLVNLARCQRAAFRLDSHSRNLFFLSINFDASVSDILVTLTSGAALVIEAMDSIELSANILSIIGKRRITHADLPPSLLRKLEADDCPDCLRTIVIGGEATEKETVRNWSRKVNLVNVYGPTETTVCTSLCHCTEDWDTPIIGEELTGVHYSIYSDGLLDAAEGELWISGQCLAIGYYQNAELTARKFPTLNGTRYYRTSDHVRRLEDGSIAFLGRYDRQVKFHGQLVELEEIEANLKALRLVNNAAVVKRQVSAENTKEMLVAFVETSEQINRKEATNLIRKALRMTLPAWMIPGHIEIVDQLPKVTSGKVNLRALESIELPDIAIRQEEYASESEKNVALLMAEILKVPYMNPRDSFFEMGADSLDTMVLIARLQNELSISVTLEQLKRHASPHAICQLGSAAKSMAISSSDLEGEWQHQLPAATDSPTTERGMIMITGATGFLGSHILAELANRREFDGKDVVCLIRCSSAQHGMQRLENTCCKYGLSLKDLGRITIIPSDLSKDLMGMDAKTYGELSSKVTDVFHCAATVNMMADYNTLRDSNVIATKRILDFCLTNRKKTLNYASTLSVFVSTSRNEGVAFESDHLEEACTIYGGYGQTKYVCEKLLLSVPDDLLCTNIIRYGLLCGDTEKGRSAPKDFLGMFIKGATTVGALPIDHTNQLGIDITPIDIASKITLDIALSSHNGVYHVAAENPLKYNELCSLLQNTSGVALINDFQEWKRKLALHKDASCVSALEMSLCRMDSNAYDAMRYMDLFQTTNIRFDMTNTHRHTQHRVYQNEKLIVKYINSFVELTGGNDSGNFVLPSANENYP